MKTRHKIFVLLEICIYICFIIMDFKKIDSSLIKYVGVILCLLNSLLNKNILISLSLLFTLISDYFLLLTDYNVLLGVFMFVLVQFIYMFFLYKNGCKLYLPIRLFFYVICIGFIISKQFTLIYILALFYFSTLVMNTISSYSNHKLLILSVGLSLFIGCDICVGLHNIMNYGIIYKIVTMMMWVFYLPSQVLISIGGNVNVER